MEIEKHLHQLVSTLQFGSGADVDLVAHAGGYINPLGSFFDADPLRALTRDERCRRIVSSGGNVRVSVEQPFPPPPHPAMGNWIPAHRLSLTPRDYPGLGGRPRFSVRDLRFQCAQIPGAVESAVLCALQTETRVLCCQSLHCDRQLTPDMGLDCRVCAICMMGVYCPPCAQAGPATLCRVCLMSCTIRSMPSRWIGDRRDQLAQLLANPAVATSPGADTDVALTLVHFMLPAVLMRLFPSRT